LLFRDPQKSWGEKLLRFKPTQCDLSKSDSQEYQVANNKNPDEKQPGEKQPGKFHYNPGNMSGKTAGTTKTDKSHDQSVADKDLGNPDSSRSER
jgi:hypothetical protein